jgi:phage terminase large subunit
MSETLFERPTASQLRDELRQLLQTRQRESNYPLYRDDPVGFIEDILGESPWSIQKRIAYSVRDNPNTAVPSCFGSGKDWIASRIATWWVEAMGGVLVATSNSFPQLRDIFWRELRRAHSAGNLRGRPSVGNDLRWEVHETGAFAIGRKPDDNDPESMQGTHAERVLVILDEANGIPDELYNATSGLVVNEASRRLAIGNPWEPVGPFFEACRSATWNVVPISVFDTPNFTGEPVPDKARKELVSPFWLEERRKEGLEGTPWWVAKVMGQFPDSSSDQVVPLALVESARVREYVVEPRDAAGLDVARFGTDDSVLMDGGWNGPERVEIVHGQSTMHVAGMGANYMKTRRGALAVDVIGVGAGVVDRLREQRLPGRVIEVNAGAGAVDGDRFINLRAELWWSIREAFQRGEISLARLDEKTYQRLRSELTAPTYRYTSSGKVQIESKEELKARGQPSPDVADALCLWNYARGRGGRRVARFGAVA